MTLSEAAALAFTPDAPLVRSLRGWPDNPVNALHAQNRKTLRLREQIDKAFKDLMYSPTFRALTEQCPPLETMPVFFTALPETDGIAAAIYNNEEKFIAVNHVPRIFDLLRKPGKHFLHFMAHEYRHAFQDLLSPQFGIYDGKNLKNDLVRLLVIEADAYAFQATCAWELHYLGISSRHWQGLAHECFGIAGVFESAVNKNPDALYNGYAQTQAVLAFFLDHQRVNFYAKLLIEDIRKTMNTRPQPVKTVPNKDHAPSFPRPMLMGYKKDKEDCRDRPLYLHETLLPTDHPDYYLSVLSSNVRRELALLEIETDIFYQATKPPATDFNLNI